MPNKLKDYVTNGLLFDGGQTFEAKTDPVTGFLTAPVTLSRIGVQHYMGFELGLTDRLTDKIGVMRLPEEVFHPDSIKSFVNLTVTDDHPADYVTTDNVKRLQKGQVSGVEKAGDVLAGVVTVTDTAQIKKIREGKREVSVGYSNDLKDQKGEYNGVEYDFVQTNIRANHLAIVDAGRCGPSCGLTMDNNSNKEKIMPTITIDSIQYTVEDAQLVQAIQNQQTAHDAEVENLKKKLTEEEEEKLELKKKKDKAEAEKDAVEKEKMSDADLSALVSERAALIVQAQGILGDKMPECTDCHIEIKTAVIDHILPDMELDGKSEDYINAAFDMAIKKNVKADDTLKNLEKDFMKDKDGNKITRESARAKYMKDELQMVS
ncbi:MAG: hypothetical protein DRH26_03485 [Deltaproteobacteria bacterium]|nr:MAG: hypothetical protein DRH26_03485 [Deltaproteobacteria bacterium]